MPDSQYAIALLNTPLRASRPPTTPRTRLTPNTQHNTTPENTTNPARTATPHQDACGAAYLAQEFNVENHANKPTTTPTHPE